MPAGTYIRDANAINLLTGATLNSAGTTTGTIQTINKPNKCRLEVLTSTVTGTSPTLSIKLQSSSTSDFSADVIDHGSLDFSGSGQSNTAAYLDVDIKRKYVRASVTVGGTSPVYTSSTAKLVARNVGRDKNATA